MEQYKHTGNPFYNDRYNDTQTFKISGTPLEVIQSLAWVRALGGGHVRIGMGLLNAKAQYYTGISAPEEFKGRLNQEDLEIIRELTQNQKWVKSVEEWRGEIVTHDLDKVDYTRDKDNTFNMHPMDRFGKVLKVHWTQWQRARMNSWLDIPANVGRPMGKAIVICGTGWIPKEGHKNWALQGLGNVATFVGPKAYYDEFSSVTGITCEHVETSSIWDLATWISGTQQVIGTPGWGIALAQALNKSYSVQKVPNLDVWNDPWILQERANNSAF